MDGRTKAGKWALVILPLITVLREGIEAVVFVGGVSLGQPGTSLPLAAIVGILCGLGVGYLIYAFASRTSQSLLPSWKCSLPINTNSLDNLPDYHDQLDPPDRIRLVQQVNRLLPEIQVQQAVRSSFLVGIADADREVIVCFPGWALMLMMLAATDRGRTTSVETSGTLTAATPKTNSTTRAGRSSLASSGGRTTVLSVSFVVSVDRPACPHCACRFRHDSRIYILLDRGHGHLVRLEAKRYGFCSGAAWVANINGNVCAETKARAQA